jgi:hypothetical protein
MWRRVILESPYAGDVLGNTGYARECMLHCLGCGDAPMVSHLLYTQVLDDTDPGERSVGINAGLAWGPVAEATVVYTDLGISDGMHCGIEDARRAGRPIEYRSLHA